ncbi:hypothetical protein GF336_03085 [Candidatus Woesearchaeota archaeon]|nr:hypothetical protein [Candidatus Woesearchaeota archaeon]
MKTSILKIMLIALSLFLCASIAYADVVVQGTYDKDNPTFGDADQQASNSEADDEDDEDIYNSTTITVKNNGTSNITISSITSVGDGFSDSDLNITLKEPVTIEPNKTKGIELKARIPEDLDAVETDKDEDNYLEPVAIKVAEITFKDDSGSSIGSFNAYMQRKNELTFDDDEVELSINGGSGDTLEDGDRTDDKIIPGEDDLKLTVVAANGFSSSDELDIEDVEATIVLDDDTDSSWDWDDVDKSEDIGTIEYGDEEEGEIEFSITDEVDDYDDYEAEVYLTGEDENGAKHGAKLSIRLDLDRESYDFNIDRADLGLSTLACTRTTELDIKIESLGSKGDDEVSLYVTSDALGIDYEKTGIELEEYGDDDDSYTKIIPITVPDDFKAGTYPINIKVYYSGDDDDGVHADEIDRSLKVEDCQSSGSSDGDDDDEDETDVITIPTTGDDENKDLSGDSSAEEDPDDEDVVVTTESSFRDSTAYTAVLILAVLAALGSSIFLAVTYFIKK